MINDLSVTLETIGAASDIGFNYPKEFNHQNHQPSPYESELNPITFGRERDLSKEVLNDATKDFNNLENIQNNSQAIKKRNYEQNCEGYYPNNINPENLKKKKKKITKRKNKILKKLNNSLKDFFFQDQGNDEASIIDTSAIGNYFN